MSQPKRIRLSTSSSPHAMDEQVEDLPQRTLSRSMDELAIEWLADILDFLPTQKLFSIMRTSRKFYLAAGMTLRSRKFLAVHALEDADDDDGNEYVLRTSYKIALSIGIPNPDFYAIKLKPTTWLTNEWDTVLPCQSLLVMTNLTRVEVDYTFVDGEFDQVIIQNSAHLQHVAISTLPVRSESGPVSYPQLRSLDCGTFETDDGKEFPALRSLKFCVGDDEEHNLQTIKLPNLEKLKASTFSETHRDLSAFIANHASSLIECELDCMLLPVAPSVVYEKLESLTCKSLTAEAAMKIPAIKRINLKHQDTGDLNGLPHSQILHFQVYSHVTAEEWLQLLTTISRMRNLQELYFFSLNRFEVVIDFPDLFTGMHNLQKVSIENGKDLGDEETQSRLLTQLAQNNPDLREVKLCNMFFTEEVMNRFAMLEKLEIVIIESRAISEDMMLTLLRGNSRPSMKEIKVSGISACQQIEPEIEAMAAEKGTTFKYSAKEFYRSWNVDVSFDPVS